MIEIQGAVEVMVLLGMVDAIVEIVETGNSLVENDLVEIDRVLEAEAVLIGTSAPRDPASCDQLIRRIDGVLAAARFRLLEFNCPASKIDEAVSITRAFLRRPSPIYRMSPGCPSSAGREGEDPERDRFASADWLHCNSRNRVAPRTALVGGGHFGSPTRVGRGSKRQIVLEGVIQGDTICCLGIRPEGQRC